MIGIWQKITHYGIREGMPESLASRVRITNQVAFSISVLAFLYSFLFMYLGYMNMGVLLLIVITPGFLSPLILNYQGRYMAARQVFLLTFNSAVFLYAWYFGYTSGIHYILFTLTCFPWIFFDLKTKGLLAFYSGLSIAFFFIFELQILDVPIVVNEAAMAILKPAVLVVSFIVLIIVLYYFLLQTSIKEYAMALQNKNLQDLSSNLREKLDREKEVRKETQLMEGFSDILRRYSSDSHILCTELLRELVDSLHLPLGGIFLLQDNLLQPIAVYAYSKKVTSVDPQDPKSGLLGEAVRSQKSKVLREVPAQYLSIQSAVGKSSPHSIVAIPIPFEQGILGVIELASFSEFKPSHLAFLERMALALGVALNNSLTASLNRSLLDDLNQRNKELARQKEELIQLRASIEERFRIQTEGQEQLIARSMERHRTAVEELQKKLAEKEVEIQNLKR